MPGYYKFLLILGQKPLPDLREWRLGVDLANTSALASQALRDACLEEVNGIHPHLCPILLYFIRRQIGYAIDPVNFWIEIPFLCGGAFSVSFTIILPIFCPAMWSEIIEYTDKNWLMMVGVVQRSFMETVRAL